MNDKKLQKLLEKYDVAEFNVYGRIYQKEDRDLIIKIDFENKAALKLFILSFVVADLQNNMSSFYRAVANNYDVLALYLNNFTPLGFDLYKACSEIYYLNLLLFQDNNIKSFYSDLIKIYYDEFNLDNIYSSMSNYIGSTFIEEIIHLAFKIENPQLFNHLDRIKGCIIGGALGDALGYPVEFYKIGYIHKQYGKKGIIELVEDDKSNNSIVSDDTQMTLFTIEGLINYKSSKKRITKKEVTEFEPINGGQNLIVESEVNDGYRFTKMNKKEFLLSYHRWLYTQTGDKKLHGYKTNNIKKLMKKFEDSDLLNDKRLFVKRAPGNTCITALSSGKYATITNRINDSKGCGGVMRVAPIGLMFDNPLKSFILGCEVAAMTHSHDLGFLSAGFFSSLISLLNIRFNLIDSINRVLKILEFKEDTSELTKDELETYNELSHLEVEELIHIIKKAVKKAQFTKQYGDNCIHLLGRGWVGEEALAMALYSALVHEDNFKEALVLSVNHDGDSDSTGSICGNIMGVIHGYSNLPIDWIDKVELVDLMEDLSEKLFTYKY